MTAHFTANYEGKSQKISGSSKKARHKAAERRQQRAEDEAHAQKLAQRAAALRASCGLPPLS